MKPMQMIEINDWVSCANGLPLGSSDQSPITDLDVDVLFECEMEPHDNSGQVVVTVSLHLINFLDYTERHHENYFYHNINIYLFP